MGVRPTNDFNTLMLLTPYQLSAALQYKLVMLVENGGSIVNPYSDLDRAGLSAKGRARKEREREDRAFRQVMAELQEQRERFQRELDLREQASLEALHENEEQTRAAREELRKIQVRAYEVTLPDGTVAKVYRDGDKVRTDDGAEVSPDVIRAGDIPDRSPQWDERKSAGERIETLAKEREKIIEYREKLDHARKESERTDVSAQEIGDLKAELEEMPDSVRAHYRAPAEPHSADQEAAPEAGASSMHAFKTATAGEEPSPADNRPASPARQQPATAVTPVTR